MDARTQTSRFDPTGLTANAAILHELSLSVLGGDGQLRSGGLSVAMDRDFGSFERWRDQFAALARTVAGGSGWAVLAWSASEARLVNDCITGEPAHLLASGTPLLALGLPEPANQADQAAKVAAGVDSFFGQLSWQVVSDRYVGAVEAFSHSCGVNDVAGWPDPQLVDVRRADVFARATDLVTGAVWGDPATAEGWINHLDAARAVVVYCVHGHEVSRSIALLLRARGFNAHYLTGGLTAWKAKGLPTVAKVPAAEAT